MSGFDASFTFPRDLSLRITSDSCSELCSEQELLLGAHLPGIDRAESVVANPSLELRHQTPADEQESFAKSDSTIWLRDSWSNIAPRDLQHVLYAAMRTKFLEQGLFSVHSACVSNEKQVLILGHSGAGKSTAALELVCSANWKMHSGNKTLVEFTSKGELEVVAGTSTMTLREESAEQAKELAEVSFEYGRRVAFRLEPGRFVTASEQPVSAIVLVDLNEANGQTQLLRRRTALNTVFPYFIDSVNADVVMSGGKGVFRSDTPAESLSSLASSLELSVSSLPVYRIAGKLEYVAEQISAL